MTKLVFTDIQRTQNWHEAYLTKKHATCVHLVVDALEHTFGIGYGLKTKSREVTDELIQEMIAAMRRHTRRVEKTDIQSGDIILFDRLDDGGHLAIADKRADGTVYVLHGGGKKQVNGMLLDNLPIYEPLHNACLLMKYRAAYRVNKEPTTGEQLTDEELGDPFSALAAAYAAITASTVATIIAASVIVVGAIALIRYLTPDIPDAPQFGTPERGSPTYSLDGGSNASRPDSPFPIVMGNVRCFPAHITAPFNYYSRDGIRQFFVGKYTFGVGDIVATDGRVGETPISDYANRREVNWLKTPIVNPTSTGTLATPEQRAIGYELTDWLLYNGGIQPGYGSQLDDIDLSVVTRIRIRNIPANIGVRLSSPFNEDYARTLFGETQTTQRQYRDSTNTITNTVWTTNAGANVDMEIPAGSTGVLSFRNWSANNQVQFSVDVWSNQNELEFIDSIDDIVRTYADGLEMDTQTRSEKSQIIKLPSDGVGEVAVPYKLEFDIAGQVFNISKHDREMTDSYGNFNRRSNGGIYGRGAFSDNGQYESFEAPIQLFRTDQVVPRGSDIFEALRLGRFETAERGTNAIGSSGFFFNYTKDGGARSSHIWLDKTPLNMRWRGSYFEVKNQEATNFRRTVGFRLNNPQANEEYKLFFRQAMYHSTDSTVNNKLSIERVKAYYKDVPANYPSQANIIIVALGADEKVSGRVAQVSYQCSQKIPVYDKAVSKWTDADDYNGALPLNNESSNPAAILRWFAKGIYGDNRELLAGWGLDPDMIDDVNLADWYNFCVGANLSFNFVVDTRQSVKDVMTLIAKAGRAALSWRTTKFGVTIDYPFAPITRTFTEADIVQDSLSGVFRNETPSQAIRANFRDEDNDYEQATIEVNRVGVVNPETYQTLNLIGVTNRAQAEEEARLAVRQDHWRSTTISFKISGVDLQTQVGDVIGIKHKFFGDDKTRKFIVASKSFSTNQQTTLQVLYSPDDIWQGLIDAGETCALADTDGCLITDTDGAIIIIGDQVGDCNEFVAIGSGFGGGETANGNISWSYNTTPTTVADYNVDEGRAVPVGDGNIGWSQTTDGYTGFDFDHRDKNGNSVNAVVHNLEADDRLRFNYTIIVGGTTSNITVDGVVKRVEQRSNAGAIVVVELEESNLPDTSATISIAATATMLVQRLPVITDATFTISVNDRNNEAIGSQVASIQAGSTLNMKLNRAQTGANESGELITIRGVVESVTANGNPITSYTIKFSRYLPIANRRYLQGLRNYYGKWEVGSYLPNTSIPRRGNIVRVAPNYLILANEPLEAGQAILPSGRLAANNIYSVGNTLYFTQGETSISGVIAWRGVGTYGSGVRFTENLPDMSGEYEVHSGMPRVSTTSDDVLIAVGRNSAQYNEDSWTVEQETNPDLQDC